MADKERHRRWEERFFFRSPKQEDKHLIFNLSPKGALCAGAEPAEVGQPVSFDMTLPNRLAELKLTGRVRWVKKVGQGEEVLYLTGIQFEEQDETTAGILKAYLQFLERDRIIQKSRFVAIEHLEKLNRLVTLVLLKKEGLPDDFQ
jgi:hypothetical protein